MAEEGQKSNVSILPQDGPIQVKATIDNFYRLITNHYGNTLRLNEMTNKPEYWDRNRKQWREWTDARESEARAYFESNYGMYSQAKLVDALAIYFNDHRVNPLLDILNKQGAETTKEQRRMFATRAFGVSSHYDTAIHSWFEK